MMPLQQAAYPFTGVHPTLGILFHTKMLSSMWHTTAVWLHLLMLLSAWRTMKLHTRQSLHGKLRPWRNSVQVSRSENSISISIVCFQVLVCVSKFRCPWSKWHCSVLPFMCVCVLLCSHIDLIPSGFQVLMKAPHPYCALCQHMTNTQLQPPTSFKCRANSTYWSLANSTA